MFELERTETGACAAPESWRIGSLKPCLPASSVLRRVLPPGSWQKRTGGSGEEIGQMGFFLDRQESAASDLGR
jgi:hypothetical protein